MLRRYKNTTIYVDEKGNLYKYTTTKGIHQIKGSTTANGYKIVNVGNTTITVHKIVMECFGSKCPGVGYEINHINHVRDDNRIENLEWLTIRQNRNDRAIYNSYKEKDKYANNKYIKKYKKGKTLC